MKRAGDHSVHGDPHDWDDEHHHQPHSLRLPQRELHQGVQVRPQGWLRRRQQFRILYLLQGA